MSSPSSPLRVVVVSHDVPQAQSFKGLSASMMTLHGYVDHLCANGHSVLHVIVLDGLRQGMAEKLEAYKTAMAPRGVQVAWWQVPSFLRERARSWQRLRSHTVSEEVLRTVRAFAPDVLFSLDVFGLATMEPLTGVPTLVQVHDPKFQTLWYHSLYEVRERPSYLLRLPMDWWRSRLWKNFYRSVLRAADRVIAIAGTSVRELRTLGIDAHYVPMLWPEPERKNVQPQPQAKPTFLFLGNLSGLGSRSALHFLLEGVYPRAVQRWGKNGFTMYVCGAHKLPSWVEGTIAKMPEVEFKGFVDDIEALMLRCHAALAPIEVKTGNRTRILTAMSLGVPTVNHAHTALGNLSLRDGETCYLASDPGTFIERMERTVRRGPEVESIIAAAKKVFADEYAPKAAGDALVRELRATISAARARNA